VRGEEGGSFLPIPLKIVNWVNRSMSDVDVVGVRDPERMTSRRSDLESVVQQLLDHFRQLSH